MLNYHKYQQAVYDWLLKKNNKDAAFTFSTRVKGSKGAELNYFIGTEKSGYFGTTFWMIPVGFPGSSGDLIDVIFGYSENGLSYYIEFTQTKAPDPGQNTWALHFLELMKPALKAVLPFQYESAEKNKMYTYRIAPEKPEYTSIEDLLNDLDKQLNIVIPIVDNALLDEKKINPSFEGHRFTSDEFSNYQSRLVQRFERFSHIQLEKSESSFETVLAKFNQEHLSHYINFLIEIITHFKLKKDDQRLVFNYSNERLVLIVNQRYTWSLHSNGGIYKYGVLATKQLSEEIASFKGVEPLPFFSYLELFAPSVSDKKSIFEGIERELNRSKNSGYRMSNNKIEFEEYVFNQVMSKSRFQNPINQILYGPPGTGKTFTLKTEYFPQYTTKEINLTQEQHVENVIRDLTWWQVIAIVVLKQGKTKVGSILNHPWIIQKAKLSNSNTVRPTLWGQLQSHTVPTCEFVNVKAKQQPFIFNKTEDSYWEIVEEELKEHSPEIYDTVKSLENFKPDSSKEIKRYVFTTFHQSFNYEDFIEGIKPVLTDTEGNSDVAYQIEDGIFKALCKRAESDPENRYAIFIDEINRGNVSNIFGELITLIEHDKRKGAEHAMSATLPYSKQAFSVPSNVDIYGTMNTADRSVEALDSALRRRFSFTEMLPQPELIKTVGPLASSQGKLNGIDLSLLLTTINKRIEKLLDKDHQIGHSYFLHVANLDQLKKAFQASIIPLLQEYFFGDYGKIGLVLGQGFFAVQEATEDENFFAAFNDYELDGILDKKVYHLIDVTQLDDAPFTELVLAILPRS